MHYFKVNSEGFIVDHISFPYEGFVKYEGELPALVVHGGWHKLIDGKIVEVPELNPNTIENKISKAIDDYTLELIEKGAL